MRPSLTLRVLLKEISLPHELIGAGLTKVYATAAGTLTVLDEVTLHMRSGEGAVAVGPSSAKT